MAIHIHTQSTPSATWTVTHSLGKKFVNIDVIISYNGQMLTVYPEAITMDSTTQATITFSTPQTGEARLSV